MHELFDQNFIDSIFKILKSILLIGNIQFNIDKQDGESIIISDDSIPILNNISELLQLNFESETQSTLQVFVEILTAIVTKLGSEKIVTKFTLDQCIFNKNGWAMSLYERLFKRVISAINDKLSRISGGLV